MPQQDAPGVQAGQELTPRPAEPAWKVCFFKSNEQRSHHLQSWEHQFSQQRAVLQRRNRDHQTSNQSNHAPNRNHHHFHNHHRLRPAAAEARSRQDTMCA